MTTTLNAMHYFLLFLALLVLNFNHKFFVVFSPFIADRWDVPIERFELALLVVQFASVGASLVAMLLKVSPKTVMIVTQVVLACITAVLCVPVPFAFVITLRFMFGLCRSPLMSAVMAAIGIWVPENGRGWVIGWIQTSSWLSDILLPVGGLVLASGSESFTMLLAALGSLHLGLALAVGVAFPSASDGPKEEAMRTPLLKDDKADGVERETRRIAVLRSLLSPGPLACIAWSGVAHTVYYVFLTILGVWLHDSFGLDSSATGFCATLIGMGNFGGFVLNLGLTDKLGARWAVLSATCAMVVVYSSLCLVTFLAPGSLPLALAETLFIFVFSEFGFLASITWATVACPKELGVPQLTMSLAFRAAAGFGSCLGTIIALPLYESAGIALNASVAAAFHALFLLAVRNDSKKVLRLISGRST